MSSSPRTLERVEKAWQWIDLHAGPLPSDRVDLIDAHGHVLATAICAPMDVPPVDRAAVDGYAVPGMATLGAGAYHPLVFLLPMEAALEHSAASAGAAVPVTAGMPLPQGTDAIVPAAFAEESDGQVEVTAAFAPGENVVRRGMAVAQGACLLPAGRRLRWHDLALLSSVGSEQVGVIRQPRIRLVVTGSELVAAGQRHRFDQVFETNSVMLRGLLARDGGRLENIWRTQDDRTAIRNALLAAGADIILISGGSGLGRNDYTAELVAEEGELALHGLALEPASSAGLGRIGGALLVLLPGDPGACLCAYEVLGARAVRLMGGGSANWPYAKLQAEVGKKIVSSPGRTDYCLVRLVDGCIEPCPSGLYAASRADGFIVVPEACEGYPPGVEITVYRYAFCDD